MESRKKWLKPDYLTDAPYAYLYELRGDAFAHQAERERMAEEAKELYGFKTFKGMYRAYEERKRGVSAGSTGNVTEFTGQPFELDVGQWRADDVAISRNTDRGEEIACVHPVMPVKRLVNVDTNMEKLELAYKHGAAWRRIVVDKQTLASNNKIVCLSDNGIAVTSENSKAFVKYLHDVENMNYDIIPEFPSIGRFGHIPGHGFSPYVPGLVFDGDAAFSDTFKAVQQRGNFEEWIDMIRRMRAYAVPAKIVIAASFASALVEPLGALPFFVHLWASTSGTGKTVALMAAASVWADPTMGRYIKTFDGTGVGYEIYAGFLNSLPMIIDELQLARDEKGRSKFNVYKLAEGVGRLRGNKARGVDRTSMWRNCIITSGESPLTQDDAGAGALNRVIDLECDDSGRKIVEEGRTAAALLRANYGHAGKAFVERLTPEVLAAVTEDYERIFRELSKDDATDKQALAAALIIAADKLVSQWFFHDEPLSVKDLIGCLQTNASVDFNVRAYGFLRDWVARNANKMRKGDEMGELYGLIDGEDVYVIRSVFNQAIEDEGYSARGLLGWLRRKGCIETRGRAFTVHKKIGGVDAECVHLLAREDQGDIPF